jgi:hypothetical protein
LAIRFLAGAAACLCEALVELNASDVYVMGARSKQTSARRKIELLSFAVRLVVRSSSVVDLLFPRSDSL